MYILICLQVQCCYDYKWRLHKRMHFKLIIFDTPVILREKFNL